LSGRRIVVHSLGHARAAVNAAAALGVPLTLESARGAGGYAGPAWFKALVHEATAVCPGVEIGAVLDCGDEAGTVLAALRLGFSRVRFTGGSAARTRLAAIAAAQGAVLEEAAPDDALDLLDCRDPERLCRAFLGKTGTVISPGR
jgi:fructose/tagatose bisphosphate aldolase